MKPLPAIAAGVLCLLPAIELGFSSVRAHGPEGTLVAAGQSMGVGKAVIAEPGMKAGLFIPTFVPGCQLSPPQVKSVYAGEGKPIARPRDWTIEIFLAGDLPKRRYVVVGELQVLTRSRNTSLNNMLEYAAREARKMGGDAIVDVWPRSVSVDPRGPRILTAKIVNWE